LPETQNNLKSRDYTSIEKYPHRQQITAGNSMRLAVVIYHAYTQDDLSLLTIARRHMEASLEQQELDKILTQICLENVKQINVNPDYLNEFIFDILPNGRTEYKGIRVFIDTQYAYVHDNVFVIQRKTN
jgi:hypothetical protein